jgi:hypothetical protein
MTASVVEENDPGVEQGIQVPGNCSSFGGKTDMKRCFWPSWTRSGGYRDQGPHPGHAVHEDESI